MISLRRSATHLVEYSWPAAYFIERALPTNCTSTELPTGFLVYSSHNAIQPDVFNRCNNSSREFINNDQITNLDGHRASARVRLWRGRRAVGASRQTGDQQDIDQQQTSDAKKLERLQVA